MALSAARVAGRNRPTTTPAQDDQQQLVTSIASSVDSMVRSDAESLVASEDVPSRHSVVSELELMFRPVRVTPAVIVHMVMLLGLLLAVFLLPFPFFCKYDQCPLQTYTLQALLHLAAWLASAALLHLAAWLASAVSTGEGEVLWCDQCPLQTYTLQALLHLAAWLASAILHYILHRLHFDSYIGGYSEFYRGTRLHRKFPFVVYSVGNALLLALCLVLREVPPSGDGPEPDPYPSRWPLSAFHYVQLLVTLEVLALMPVLIHYLRLVLRFNAARAPPDVADEEPEGLSARAGRRSPKDQAAYSADLLRRQADCIQALRAHNTMLGRKIVEQHARLTATSGRV